MWVNYNTCLCDQVRSCPGALEESESGPYKKEMEPGSAKAV